jgi:UDP-3-O-[3-hydroxymyristoyl] N-acetylglucosamine deacetylase / 3-hydroxyacyl-[acyl-carrier-protein] dehydratase
MSDFKDQIANCRTFVFLHELETLLERNLIKGGDLNNAIVFVDKPVSQEKLDYLATVFNKPRIEVMQEGILNNLTMRYQNEPARHKLLDVIGDLTLIGHHIKGHIIARRPGHASNVAFAKKIKQHIQREKTKAEIPTYDPNATPVFDINAIKKLLPHRAPFLLVDKIIELGASHVIGVKNVTMNEPFFAGHFPEEPVMPGVLQIEAMAQAGGILAMQQIDKPEEYTTYFLKIENVKFRRKVVPGDTLVFRLELASPMRRGLCHMVGAAYVGNKVVMEAEMMAQISKKPEFL